MSPFALQLAVLLAVTILALVTIAVVPRLTGVRLSLRQRLRDPEDATVIRLRDYLHGTDPTYCPVCATSEQEYDHDDCEDAQQVEPYDPS
jgi:hypothetical protein